jgi:hypothetical protein
VVVYDRADAPADRFKRVWWQLPVAPTVNGLQARMASAGGQQLFITALLPADATMTLVDPANDGVGETVATHEPMTQRVMVEAPAAPQARFLHLVQGADGGAAPTPATVITTDDGFVGLAVNQTAVLFAEDWDQPFVQLRYTAPVGVSQHIITGLTPGAGYSATVAATAAGVTVTILTGGNAVADAAGVLVLPAAGQASAFLPLVTRGGAGN